MQFNKHWEQAIGKAYFIGARDIGRLKVSFFGPFYGGYNIIELDDGHYNYAMVAGPNTNYLWILARSPELDKTIIQQLRNKASQLGFDTNEIIYVDQTNRPDN